MTDDPAYDDDESAASGRPDAAAAGKPAAAPPDAPKIEWGLLGTNTHEDLSIFLGGGRARGVVRMVAAGVTYTPPAKGGKPPKSVADMVWRPVDGKPQAYELPFAGDPTEVLTLEEFAREVHGPGFPAAESGRPPAVDPARLEQLDQVVRGLAKLAADLHALGYGIGTAHPPNVLLAPRTAGGRTTYQVLLPDLGFVYPDGSRRLPKWLTDDEYEYLPLWAESALARQHVTPLRSPADDLRVLARLVALLLRGRHFVPPGQPDGRAVAGVPGPDDDRYTAARVWHVLGQAAAGATPAGAPFTARNLVDELAKDENRPSLHFTTDPAARPAGGDLAGLPADPAGPRSRSRGLVVAGAVGALAVVGLVAMYYFGHDYFAPPPLPKAAATVAVDAPAEPVPPESALAPLVEEYRRAKTPAERAAVLGKLWQANLSRDRATREKELAWREHLRVQYRLDWERRYAAVVAGYQTDWELKDRLLPLYCELKRLESDPQLADAHEDLKREEKRCLADLEALVRGKFDPGWPDAEGWFSCSPP